MVPLGPVGELANEQDLDAAASQWNRRRAHHRPAATQKPNVNKDGNQRFFGGAYHPGYGAFRG